MKTYFKEWYAARPLYYVWQNMRQRCSNKNRKDYHRYGGRGIRVCDRWEKYENFKEDMLCSYKEGHQLDRVDNDKEYSLENCRWATLRQQNTNKSTNRIIVRNGLTNTLTGWARFSNTHKNTIGERLKAGWSVNRAITYKPLTKTI